MQLFDYIQQARYVSFPDDFRGPYTAQRDDTYKYGRREVWLNIRSQYGNPSLPKRFPRVRIAEAFQCMSYVDKQTGFSMRADEIDVHFYSYKNQVMVKVRADIANRRGRIIGNAYRSFYYTRGGKALYVEHDEIELDDSQQGKGFSRRYLAWAQKQYPSYGFAKIKTYAAGGKGSGYNGGYTWARLGFRPTGKVSIYKHESAQILSEIRRDYENGKVSKRLLTEVTDALSGNHVKDMRRLAMLGKKAKYRTKDGNHIGKEIILRSVNGYNAELHLSAA